MEDKWANAKAMVRKTLLEVFHIDDLKDTTAQGGGKGKAGIDPVVLDAMYGEWSFQSAFFSLCTCIHLFTYFQ